MEGDTGSFLTATDIRTPSAPRPPMSAQGSARRSAHPPDSAPARVTQSQRSARSWRSEFSQAFTEQRPHTHRGVGSAGLVPPLKLPTEGHNAPRPTSSARSGRGTWRNETTHRRYNFTDANGRSNFANTPHGIAVSDSRTPSLKHFDVICPQWVDNSVSESRTHTKLYYSDLLGAAPVAPPIGADEVTWDVEALKEFLLTSRPRTRLDAYPLLVMTQGILRRFADREIRLLNEKEEGLLDEISRLKEQMAVLFSEAAGLREQLSDHTDLLNKHRTASSLKQALFSASKKQLEASVEEMGAQAESISKMDEENKRLHDKLRDLERRLREAQTEAQMAKEARRSAEARAEKAEKLAETERNRASELEEAKKAAEADRVRAHGEGAYERFAALGLSQEEKGQILVRHMLPDAPLLAAVGCRGMGDAWALEGEAGRDAFLRCLLELALADPDGASRLAALLGDGLADQLAAALAPPASEAAAAPEVPVVDAETQTAGELVQHPSAQAQEGEGDAAAGAPSGTLKARKKPKYPPVGSKMMPPENVIRLVHEAFEAKILADARDDTKGRARQDFVAFTKDFVTRKYGLKSIAMKNLSEIVKTVNDKHRDLAPIRLFGLVSGMLMGEEWSPKLCDFVLALLGSLCEHEGRELSHLSEWLNGDKEAGVTIEAATAALTAVSSSGHSFLPANDLHLEQLKSLPHNDLGHVFVHHLLLWSLDFLKESERRLRAGFIAIFLHGDKDGNGVLELEEFKELISHLVPPDAPHLLEDRGMMELYNEMLQASEDHTAFPDCILKEAFAEIALLRGLTCPDEFLDRA